MTKDDLRYHNPMVSVIIPIYNTEKELLLSCFKSIQNQIYKNLEIVLVDDGSNDEVRSYCDYLGEQDDRVVVIHQLNSGVSAARNNGTKVARGEYILYVDGDDLLAPVAVQEGVRHLLDDRVDVVIAGMEKIFSNEEFSWNVEMAEEYEVVRYGRCDELKRHLFALDNPKYLGIKGEGYITRGPVCRLIRKDLAQKIKFPIGVPIGEDLIWNLELLELCSSVCVVYNVWYGYLKIPTSVVRKYHGNRIEVVERYLNILLDKYNDFCTTNIDVFGKNVAVELYCVLWHELLSPQCKLSYFQKNKLVKKMLKRSPWNYIGERKVYNYISIRYKVLYVLCRLGIWQIAFKVFR